MFPLQLSHQNKNETMLNITNHDSNSNTNSNSNMNTNTNTNCNSNSNSNSNCYPPQSVPPSGQLQNYNRHEHLYRQAQTQAQMQTQIQAQMQMQTPQEAVSMFSSSCGGSGLETTTTFTGNTAYSCSIPHNNGMDCCYANNGMETTRAMTSTTNFTDQQQRYLHLHNNLNCNTGGPSSILEEVILCLRDAAAPTPISTSTAAPIYSHNHSNESSSSLLQSLLLSNQNLNLNLNQNHLFATKAAAVTTSTILPNSSNDCSRPVFVHRNSKRGREWESQSGVGSSKVRFPSHHCNSNSDYHIPNSQRFRGLKPLLFSPVLLPHDSPPPLDNDDSDAEGNSDAAKNKRQKPNPLPSSISSSSTSKSKSRSTSKSISRAIRRRLQSLTCGTRLVPRNLPSIVIGSKSDSSSSSSSHDDDDDDDEKDETTNATPIVSLILPAHIPRGWNSKPLQKDDKDEQPQPTSQHQLFLRTHALLGKGSFATVESVTVESSIDSSTRSEEEDNYYYACKSTREELFVRGMTNHPNSYTNSNENSNANANETQLTTAELDRKSSRVYIQAESQLAYEAHVLGSLDHPNIVRLMGFFQISTSSASNTSSSSSLLTVVPPMDVALPERSVVLTEVLEETLGQKLSRWRKATTIDTFGSRQKQKRTLEKLSICQQLADAMEHIHSHNIAYRDLKPENVGFMGSTLKLFDFGLSREMTTAEGKHDDPTISMGVDSKTPSSSSSLSSSLRTLTPTPSSSLLRGRTGTMRYMAPEVCLDKAYDCDCDLYSYSVLCWEVWTHKTPYATLTPAAYKERVCQKGLRPPEAADVPLPPNHQKRERGNRHCDSDSEPVFGVVPESISVLLEKGWVCDPKSRIRWSNIRQELSRIHQDEQKFLQGEAL